MKNAVSSRRGPPWFRLVDRVLETVAEIFQILAECFLAIMLVINFLNIVLRNLGFPSLLWVSPWTQFLMVWAVFLAFYVMYRRHLDIVLMVVMGRFGHIGVKLSRILTAIAGLVVVGVLLAEVPQILTRQRGAMDLIGLTRFWLSVPLIASALMLFVHFLFDLVALLAGWADDETPGDEEAMSW